MDELRQRARANPLLELLSNPRWKEETAIDFAYTSAQIEGSTYSRAETIALLKMGRTAAGKSFLEARMLVNLRDAYAMILSNAGAIVEAGIDGLRKVHAALMRGILPDDQLGATRKTTRVRIAGTEYVPPDRVPYIEKQAAEIFKALERAGNPFDASVYAACNLSFLQIFENGNKRTSRVFQNAILIAADLPPIQFPISMIEAYIDAQLAYYETGDLLKHRGFVLEAYRYAYPRAADADAIAASKNESTSRPTGPALGSVGSPVD